MNTQPAAQHPTAIGDRVFRIEHDHGPGTVRTFHDASTSCNRCTGGRPHMQVEWEDTPGETFDEDPNDLAVLSATVAAQIKRTEEIIAESLTEPTGERASLRRDVNTGRAWLCFATRPDKLTCEALSKAGWRFSGYRKEWHHPRKFITPPAGIPYSDDGTVNYSDERAERSAASAERARGEAASAFRRERAIGDGIPMGQPILSGHHSEKRHRRDIARIQALAEKGVEATRKAERLEGRAGSSARLRERRQTDPGLVERRLRRLRKSLGYMEAILLQQGDKADDERVRRAHLVREEIARNEKLLDEINAELPDDAPVAVGDVIPSPHGFFLVGRVNHRTFTGWVVGGGSDAWPGRLDKTKWNGKVTVRGNAKLRAAVEYRQQLQGYYGDETWRKLTAEGIGAKGTQS
jgi:hypothetical protein